MDYNDYKLKKKNEELHFWFKAKNILIFNLLKQISAKSQQDKRILDIGCGTGTELLVLKNFGQVTALDNNNLALKQAKKTGCLVKLGDIEKTDLENNYYDIICCFDILEHLKDDLGALKKIYSSLNKNGRLLITAPAYPALFGPHDIALRHYRRYKKKELTDLLIAAGFKRVRLNYWNSILFPLEAAFRLLKKTLYIIFKPDNLSSEAKTPNRLLNNVLFKILNKENSLAASSTSLPFGLTLYGSAKK